jgi:TonB family protein
MTLCPKGLLAVWVTVLAITSAQQTTVPVVVLSRIEVFYPPIAEAARVSGTVTVRVGVRPDGTVAETALVQGLPLLNDVAIGAASRASFECRKCTQPSTPHLIAFVFSFDGFDSAGKPPTPVWKQTGDARSEVTVFGGAYILGPGPGPGPPSKPVHVRAPRCLWLWRCSKQAYITPIE